MRTIKLNIVRFFVANNTNGVVYTINGQKASTFLRANEARAIKAAHKVGADTANELLADVLGMLGAEFSTDADECTVGAIVHHINANNPHHKVRATFARGFDTDCFEVTYGATILATGRVNGHRIKMFVARHKELNNAALYIANVRAVVATEFMLNGEYDLDVVTR